MTATPETIWQVPAYLPYLQPPLTNEAITAAENDIGFRLPDEYLDLLRKQNGGYIRLSLPDLEHDCIAGIGPYYPSLAEIDWAEAQEHVSYPLYGLVPFDGDGHWHICLDYRHNTAIPSVCYVDIECDQQSQVATTFADYLALLRVDVSDEYVLESVRDINEIISHFSSTLCVDFEPPDYWAHGYPIHRASLGTDGNPEWLWVSPNSVPRGFVRSDDSRYSELKDVMQGRALLYPEIPDSSFLLTTTDGVRSKVVDACNGAQFVIKPLSEYIKGT